MRDERLKPAVTRFFFKHLGFYYEWLMTARYEQAIRREFVEFLNPHADDSLIEFGCGPGNFLEMVAPHCRIAYGLDASRSMLQRAERGLKRAGIHNVEFIHSSLESFQPTLQCDWAVGVAFLYQFQNPSEVLRKMRSCVRPGGYVASLDPSAAFVRSNVNRFMSTSQLSFKERYVLRDWLRAAKFYQRFADQELEGLYAAAGLQGIRLEHTLNGMVVFSKGRM